MALKFTKHSITSFISVGKQSLQILIIIMCELWNRVSRSQSIKNIKYVQINEHILLIIKLVDGA